ncbi:unnamed protein product, partial [Discosporangium mesarthrocarpum]
MDIAVPLLYETLKALGCNFMPLFQVEELSEPAPDADQSRLHDSVSMKKLGCFEVPGGKTSFACLLELPTFLTLPRFDTRTLKATFRSKNQARAAVAFLAVKEMHHRGYINTSLNPHRAQERMEEMGCQKGYDPVLPEGKALSKKTHILTPRAAAMGMPLLPQVDLADAQRAEYVGQCAHYAARLTAAAVQAAAAAPSSAPSAAPSAAVAAAAEGGEGEEEDQPRGMVVELMAAVIQGSDTASQGGTTSATAEISNPDACCYSPGAGDDDGDDPMLPAAAQAPTPALSSPNPLESSRQRLTPGEGPTPMPERGQGLRRHPWGRAFPGGERTAGVPSVYERYGHGPKKTLLVYCLSSPRGELDGAQIGTLWPQGEEADPLVEGDGANGDAVSDANDGREGKENEGGLGQEGGDSGGSSRAESRVPRAGGKLAPGEDYHTDWRTFDAASKVDLGRGEAVGLGPRLFVGLAVAGPMRLTPSQERKIGVVGVFSVELNSAQLSALIQWHRDTVGMVAVSIIPPQMSSSPRNNPDKDPFHHTGSPQDRGMFAVPLAYSGEDGVSGDPFVDWVCVEDCNTGRQLPDDEEEEAVRRIFFCKVSHKTCRFYFPLERLQITLGEYLDKCDESGKGPYAGLPAEDLTKHDVGKMGRTKDMLAVGHGCSKPDYEAAYKWRRLLLCVPAPALRHSFAQHLIRSEKHMDPDAGMRGRVKLWEQVTREEMDGDVAEEEGDKERRQGLEDP